MKPESDLIRVTILGEKRREGVKSYGNGGALSVYRFVEVQMKGGRDKKCRCEHCDLTFVYPMHREVVGRAETLWGMFPDWTRRRARRQAVAMLERALVVECDAVPCPACGMYQAQMSRRMFAGKQHREPRTVANRLILFGSLLAVVASGCGALGFAVRDGSNESGGSAVTLAITAGVLVIGLVLIAVGIVGLVRHARRKASYDPYQWSTHEERLQLARDLSAVTLDDYRAAERRGIRLLHPSERQVLPAPYLPPPVPNRRSTRPDEGTNPFDFQ